MSEISNKVAMLHVEMCQAVNCAGCNRIKFFDMHGHE